MPRCPDEIVVAIYKSYPHTQDNAAGGNAAHDSQNIVQNTSYDQKRICSAVLLSIRSVFAKAFVKGPSHRTFSRLPFLLTISDPQDEVHHYCEQENNGQECGTKAVVEARLTPHPYRLRSPVIRRQRIYHCGHRDAGKKEGRNKRWSVSEVQHPNGEGA